MLRNIIYYHCLIKSLVSRNFTQSFLPSILLVVFLGISGCQTRSTAVAEPPPPPESEPSLTQAQEPPTETEDLSSENPSESSNADNISPEERFNQGVAAFEAHDGKTAFEMLIPLAENGDPRAQEIIGRLFYRGKDKIPRDCALAKQWFTVAADQNYPPAQNALGLLHHTGCGLPFDLNKAAEWYAISADAGFAPAQYNLAHMYTLGSGLVKDLEQALYWYGKAADQGYPLAITEKKRLERRMKRGGND